MEILLWRGRVGGFHARTRGSVVFGAVSSASVKLCNKAAKGSTRNKERVYRSVSSIAIHVRIRGSSVEIACARSERDSIDRVSGSRDARDRCTLRRKSRLRGKVGDSRKEEARRLEKGRRMNWKNRLRRVEKDADADDEDDDDDENDDYDDYEEVLKGGRAKLRVSVLLR